MSSRASSTRPSRRKPIAACVAAVFALSAPALVHAAVDWQVTNCKTDGTPGTLTWAAANANGVNGDTINLTTITDFSNCTAGSNGPTGPIAETISVSSQVTLATGGVTINGPGSASLAVSGGGGNHRVFYSPGDLTINGLTVKYASPTASSGVLYGGCIEARNNLILNDVGFTHCYATNSNGSAKGGAVASYDNDVDMTNVVINRTHATVNAGGNASGGAVYAFHNVSMTNSTITTGGPYLCLFPPCTPPTTSVGAYVTSGTGNARGGGVFSSIGGFEVYLNNSSITGTHATQSDSGTGNGSANGGAIWSTSPVALTNDSVVIGTASTASTGGSAKSLGGGVYSAGNVEVVNSTVWQSSTSSSGGSSRGGGVYSKGATTLKYAYITLDDANGNGAGGGIFSNNGFTSNYSYFWADHAGQFGGAVDVSGGNSYVRGTSVNSNSASLCCSGLDFHAGGASVVSIKQSTISNNGGTAAIYSRAYNTKIYNSTIVYNNNSGGTMSGVYVVPGNAGSTVTIASNLMSSNTYGGSATKNDFFVGGGDTISGDHNLIRNPGTGVPGDTITGKCPLLYPGKFTFLNQQWQFVIRHEVPSPATNAGSNPLGLTADQRGGAIGATSPPRVSGPPGGAAVADIGSYEIDQSDEIFDNRWEGCN